MERQSPVPPLPLHFLVQHRTLSGSSGQKPGVEVPPPELQEEVERQTPEAPLSNLQAPLRAARVVGVRVVRRRRENEVKRAIFVSVVGVGAWRLMYVLCFET